MSGVRSWFSFLTVVAVLALTFVGLPAGAANALAPSSGAPVGVCSLTPGWHQMVSAGQVRSFFLVRPVKAAFPVQGSMGLHPAFGQAQQFAESSRLAQEVSARGQVMVFAQARGPWHTWDVNRYSVDTTFLRDLRALVVARGCVRAESFGVTGFSQGAMLSTQLACAWPTLFTRAAPVGGIIVTDPCVRTAKVPALIVHGTQDEIIYFDGHIAPAFREGIGVRYDTSVTRLSLARAWASRNGCTTESVRTVSPLRTVSWACPGSAPVRMVIVLGGTHVWPGSVGATGANSAYPAARTIVDFLSSPR